MALHLGVDRLLAPPRHDVHPFDRGLYRPAVGSQVGAERLDNSRFVSSHNPPVHFGLSRRGDQREQLLDLTCRTVWALCADLEVTGTDDAELRRRFNEREAAVKAYEKLWWTHQVEPQRTFLGARPRLRRELLQAYLREDVRFVPTRRVYAAEGHWAAEREVLHKRLFDRWLTGFQPGPPLAGDPVYFTIGLPGSGKTQNLRALALAHAAREGTVPVSDADEVRVSLPEYRAGLGSGVVQLESEALTYGAGGYPEAGGLQDRMRSLSGPVVVDVLGHPNYLPGTVRQLVDMGRSVYVLMTQCPVAVCEARVMRRAVAPDGRFVPLELVQKKEGIPRAALDAAIATGLLTGWGVVDTSQLPGLLVDGDGTFDAVAKRL
jgi:hypothetical protein